MKRKRLPFCTTLLTFAAGHLSMKNKKLQFLMSLLLTFAGAQVANAEPSEGAYVADQQRFYIEGQPLTEAVGSAQAIVCYLAAMRGDAFLFTGAYFAKYYEGRCDAAGADSTSEAAAPTPTSAASATTTRHITYMTWPNTSNMSMVFMKLLCGQFLFARPQTSFDTPYVTHDRVFMLTEYNLSNCIRLESSGHHGHRVVITE
mgnify:CR=1 FL=1